MKHFFSDEHVFSLNNPCVIFVQFFFSGEIFFMKPCRKNFFLYCLQANQFVQRVERTGGNPLDFIVLQEESLQVGRVFERVRGKILDVVVVEISWNMKNIWSEY